MDRRLIIEHIPRLRRYARALVGDRYVADDLVQDTLERAWNKFYLWRPGSDLRAWLFTIMHNVFVNQARRRRYEIEQAMEEQGIEAIQVPEAAHVAEENGQPTASFEGESEQQSVELALPLETLSSTEVEVGADLASVSSEQDYEQQGHCPAS